MTKEERVDILFEQAAVLTRLDHLRLVSEYLTARAKMSRTEALAHAASLDGLGYTWSANSKPLVDDVVPEAAVHEDLVPIARRAVDGDTWARAKLLDAADCLRTRSKEMELPRSAAQVGEAYLARELQRVARHEQLQGLVEGPASRLVNDLRALAQRACDAGIDTAPFGAEERWRKRLERHAA